MRLTILVVACTNRPRSAGAAIGRGRRLIRASPSDQPTNQPSACGYVRAAARCPGKRRPGGSCLPASPAPAVRRGRPASHCPDRPQLKDLGSSLTALPTAAQQQQGRPGRDCQTPPLRLSFPRSDVSARLLAPFPKTKSVRPSIHHPRPPSVSSNVNPRTRPVALVPSSPQPAKAPRPRKSPWIMGTRVLPLPSPTLPSLFLLASHRHRDAKGGHAAAP
jgi:hypothetical protein